MPVLVFYHLIFLFKYFSLHLHRDKSTQHPIWSTTPVSTSYHFTFTFIFLLQQKFVVQQSTPLLLQLFLSTVDCFADQRLIANTLVYFIIIWFTEEILLSKLLAESPWCCWGLLCRNSLPLMTAFRNVRRPCCLAASPSLESKLKTCLLEWWLFLTYSTVSISRLQGRCSLFSILNAMLGKNRLR